jgi:hypothetical protein
VTWAGSTGTTGSLICAGFADPADLEALHTGEQIKLLLLGSAAVEHVFDAGDGQGGFSNVGCEDDETGVVWWRLEDLHLFLCG